MADLDRMSLDDLCALKDGLDALVGAGRALMKAGHAPFFDLTPGCEVRILTGIYMPGRLFDGEPDFEPKSEHEPAASPLIPAAAEAPAAVIPDAAGAGNPVAIENCPPRTGPVMPVAAVPQRANLPERWTEDEDRRAVDVAVALLESGGSMAAAARAVAATTGRTQAAVRYRLDHVLQGRIEALMAHERAPAPQAESAAAPDPEVPVEATPAPEPATATDPLDAHLRSLRPLPWSDDLDLIEDACAGLDVATIAIRLERDAKSVRDRFEQLTNKRAFGREAVRDALRRMCGTPKVSP